MDDINFIQNTFEDKIEDPIIPIVYLVEDDEFLGRTIKKYFSKKLGLETRLFHSGKDFINQLDDLVFEDHNRKILFLTDISLEDGFDGLSLIDYLNEKKLTFCSIVMTGFASIENAIAATKKGAYHYLTKPFELDDLSKLVLDALVNVFGISVDSLLKSSDEPSAISISSLIGSLKPQTIKEDDIFCGMIGRSAKMRQVFERIQKVAATDSTVFITGPSGTGKELVAKAIHQLSNRREEKKVSVNCGAIPSELLESELFGHIKGSFTGAIADRQGRFEMADKGTIFLDEIGDMPLLLQVKILRVLQNKTIEPVGFENSKEVNVRVITATHKNLEQAVKDGSFREDLFYRLNVIPIKIPSLKERKEDIPLLISYFLEKYVSADGRNAIEFSIDTLELLLTYEWPGNVRELENLIERLVILKGGQTITPQDLPQKFYQDRQGSGNDLSSILKLPEDGVNLKDLITEIENSLIIQALEITGGNKNQASKLLKLNRTTLIEKMKKKNLNIDSLNQ